MSVCTRKRASERARVSKSGREPESVSPQQAGGRVSKQAGERASELHMPCKWQRFGTNTIVHVKSIGINLLFCISL